MGTSIGRLSPRKWISGRALKVLPAAALACCLVGAVVPGTASALHYAGQKCVYIYSQNDWRATVCVITNADDALAEQWDQSLVTYSVRSGGISYANAGAIWLYACEGLCARQNPSDTPGKHANGAKSTYLSNPFAFDPDDTVQAVVVTPCVDWTNGQVACYNGTLRDETISTY